MSKIIFNEYKDDHIPLFGCLGKVVDLYEIIRYLKTLDMNLHEIKSTNSMENIVNCLQQSCALQQV